MANTVQVRYRKHLPGAGFNVNGNPVTNKVEVTGRVTVTSYAAGESLPPSKLGLDTIDYIQLEVSEGVGGGAQGENLRKVGYSTTANEFYIFNVGNTVAGVPTGQNFSVMFKAEGDASTAPELL